MLNKMRKHFKRTNPARGQSGPLRNVCAGTTRDTHTKHAAHRVPFSYDADIMFVAKSHCDSAMISSP